MTTADQHRIMLRQAEAVKLRVRGYSYQMIADAIGVSKKQAFDDVKANLSASAKERGADTEEARELELMRLDNAISKVTSILDSELGFSIDGMDPEQLANLVDGKSELVLKAADRLVKLISERSKLLGLYAAEKREHTVSGASLDDIQGISSAVEANECDPKSEPE